MGEIEESEGFKVVVSSKQTRGRFAERTAKCHISVECRREEGRLNSASDVVLRSKPKRSAESCGMSPIGRRTSFGVQNASGSLPPATPRYTFAALVSLLDLTMTELMACIVVTSERPDDRWVL